MSEVNESQAQPTVVSPDALPYIQQGVAIENQRVINAIKGLCCAEEFTPADLVAVLNIISGKALTPGEWDVEFGFSKNSEDPDDPLIAGLIAEYDARHVVPAT